MAGIKGIAISFIAIGIFVFAMISFGIDIAADNDANRSISDNPAIGNFERNLSSKIDVYQEQVNASQKAFTEEEPTTDLNPLKAPKGIITTLITVPFALFNLVWSFILTNIFGGSGGAFSFLFTIIGSVIVAVMILYIWKWIRSGDAD